MIEMMSTVLSKIEELKLIARCTLGDDRRAFGTLVEAYQPQVRRFFLNLTLGDEALSDDLAQETFLKAYINVRSFRGVAKFSTWLYRIAYNEFCSWQRKTQHEASLPDGLDENFDADYYDASGDRCYSATDSVDAHIDVWRSMRVLSDTERTLVTLFYIQDYPLKKIMEITGLPEGTVKSYLSRAKAKLARVMKR